MRYKCKKCGIEKDESEFRIHKSGYRIGACKSCEREYQKQYYKNNIKKIRKKKREWMAGNRKKNPELVRKKQMEWYHANSEREKKKMRDYYHNNFYWSRAMKLRGGNRATKEDLKKKWAEQKGCCALTGRTLDKTAQVDHIIPRSRGGKDNKENIRWVCKEANLLKRNLTDEELIILCSDVMRWIAKRIQMFEDIKLPT